MLAKYVDKLFFIRVNVPADEAHVIALAEMPERWYESGYNRETAGLIGCFGSVGAGVGIYIGSRFGLEISLMRQVLYETVATVALTTGAIFSDNRTTYKGLRKSVEATELGSPYFLREGSSKIGPVRTPEEMKKSKIAKKCSAITLASSIIWPWGIGVATTTYLTAMSNRRKTKVIERTIDLINS